MHGDWFYMTVYVIFGHEVKATKGSPPDNFMRWIITQSKGFTRKGIEKISKSVRTYVYLVLTSQIHTRSSMVGDSAPAVDGQQVFKSTFKVLINEDIGIAIDIKRYQGVLEYALLKEDFSVGTGMYMLPSNLNLSVGKKKGYNNKILVSNTDMKIGLNRDINKDHKKMPPDVPKIVIPEARHDLKMLTKKYNNEKLAITFLIEGAGLIAHQFW